MDHFETPRAWADANEAVIRMGPNAFPILLRMLRAYDPPWKLKLIALAQKQRVIPIHHVPADTQRRMSLMAFESLAGNYNSWPEPAPPPRPNISQAQADRLVPALVEIYEHGPSNESRWTAGGILGEFGPLSKAAIPALLAGATNMSHYELRFVCIRSLGNIRSEPELVVPALVGALGDTNRGVREEAVMGLAKVPPDPKSAPSAVSALAGLMSDGSMDRQFIPRALTNYSAVARSAIPALERFVETAPPGSAYTVNPALKAIEIIKRDTGPQAALEATNGATYPK